MRNRRMNMKELSQLKAVNDGIGFVSICALATLLIQDHRAPELIPQIVENAMIWPTLVAAFIAAMRSEHFSHQIDVKKKYGSSR